MTDDYVFDADEEFTAINMPAGTTIDCASNIPQFGDSDDPEIWITMSQDNTFQNCNFENVNFETSWQDNITFRNNRFSADAPMQVILTIVDGFLFEYNNGLQKIQIQTAFNGTIKNNNFECRHGNNCLALTPAGGSPDDYFDPTLVPSNLDIYENNFINYNVSSSGDWIIFNTGLDINFTNNHLQSYVTLDDAFLVMMSVEKGSFNIERNSFVFPSKSGASNSGTWGLNVRTNDVDLYLSINHNSFFMEGNNSACMGLYQPTPTVMNTLYGDFSYNLCHNQNGSNSTGFTYQFDPAFLQVDEGSTAKYNGFSGIDTIVYDPNEVITQEMLEPMVIGDVLLKRENAETDDDWDYAPMSRFLDVDGTTDIGIYSGERISEYTIDDDCVVDYISCHSNESSTIVSALTSGDTVHIKNGTYDPIELDRSVENVNILGEGSNTIFEAGENHDGILLSNFSNSNISNISIKNAHNEILPAEYSYRITHALYEYNSNTYDNSAPLGMPANSFPIVFDASNCNTIIVSGDGVDISAAVGTANNSFNLALADIMGLKLTVLFPDNVVSTAAEAIDLTTSVCGIPSVSIDYFLPDLFTVNNKIFTYNASAVANAGITLKAGLTNPPRIDTTESSLIGLKLTNSSNNTFENIEFVGNNHAVSLNAGSAENSFIESNFVDNDMDIVSKSTSINKLINSNFLITNLDQQNDGSLEIYNSFRGKVLYNSDPIPNAEISVKNAKNESVVSLISQEDGLTDFSDPTLVTVIPSGGPYAFTAGGINPLQFTVSVDEYNLLEYDFSIKEPFETVVLSLTKPSDLPEEPDDGGGVGGGEDDDKDTDSDGADNGDTDSDDTDNNSTDDDDNATVKPSKPDKPTSSPDKDISSSDAKGDIVTLPAQPVPSGSNACLAESDNLDQLLIVLLFASLLFLLFKKHKDKEMEAEDLKNKPSKPKAKKRKN